jgi:dipeptidyl aminopeptidase/acylaminoacyl peptidase
LIKPEIGRIVPVGVSASGALYYCVPTAKDLPRIQLASFDFATGQLLSGPANVNEDGIAAEESPAWSPDGKNLAYVSRWSFTFGRGGNNYVGKQDVSIKIRTIETGVVREIRPNPSIGFVSKLRWAPDGASLIALGVPTPPALFRIDVRSGESSLLFKLPWGKGWGLEDPILSRDGKKVYCRRDRWNPDSTAFVEYELATTKDREIVRAAKLGGLNLSPDERYIGTASVDPSSRAKTFIIVPVDGGAPREVIRVPGDAQGAGVSLFAWAPDSRSVFIRKRLSEDDNDVGLWQAFMDGSETRKVDGKLDSQLTTGGIWVHPDGRQIVSLPAPRARVKADAQIIVLENFLPQVNNGAR